MSQWEYCFCRFVYLAIALLSWKNVVFLAVGSFSLFRSTNIADNNVKFCYIHLTTFLSYDILIVNSGERGVIWLIALTKDLGTK